MNGNNSYEHGAISRGCALTGTSDKRGDIGGSTIGTDCDGHEKNLEWFELMKGERPRGRPMLRPNDTVRRSAKAWHIKKAGINGKASTRPANSHRETAAKCVTFNWCPIHWKHVSVWHGIEVDETTISFTDVTFTRVAYLVRDFHPST